MKLFKRLAMMAMALGFCFCAGATVAACGGDNGNGTSSEQTTNAYTFIVLNADGSAAEGVNVQLCVLGNSAACFMPVAADANGEVVYTPTGFPGAGEYEIHLLSADYSTSLEFNGPVTTPTIYSTITLTLK